MLEAPGDIGSRIAVERSDEVSAGLVQERDGGSGYGSCISGNPLSGSECTPRRLVALRWVGKKERGDALVPGLWGREGLVCGSCCCI